MGKITVFLIALILIAGGCSSVDNGESVCAVGSADCSCTAGGGCDPGLLCVQGVCTADEIDSKSLGNVSCSDDPCDENATCDDSGGQTVCTCRDGYQGDGVTCDDVDECALATDNCSHTCVNVGGSFTCECAFGWAINADGFSCDDINECALATDNCDDTNGTCTNTLGSFVCGCTSGWELNIDGHTCDVSNPGNTSCSDDPCDENATCDDSGGHAVCTCRDGYQGDGVTCDDVDECALATDNCSHTCVNVGGSFTCECAFGWAINADGFSCDDINECALATDNCDDTNGTCTNTLGSFVCGCTSGWELNIDGHSCNDIDECALTADNCDDTNGTCTNSLGSFVCDCTSGWELNIDGHTCDDIDECALATDNCDDTSGTCTNTLGSFLCGCTSGWELNIDGHSCNDIDECALTTDNCDDTNGTCTNSLGSFVCGCTSGWELNIDGHTCDDIDECALATDNCDDTNGTCANTLGSFLCGCTSGWELNIDGHSCNDIDECALTTDNCDDTNGTCTNSLGSFVCDCTSGWELNIDGHTCDDIDECALATDDCAAQDICFNTPGSWSCTTIGLEWVSIPGGSFTKGDPDVFFDLSAYTPGWMLYVAAPEHTVDVPSFEILKTEVTTAQFKACVEDNPDMDPESGCTPPPVPRCDNSGSCESPVEGGCGDFLHKPNNYWIAEAEDRHHDHPVTCLTYQNARNFCEWVGGRLPTESEWQYVIKGGIDNLYPWGNEAPDCTRVVMRDTDIPMIDTDTTDTDPAEAGVQYGCGTGTTAPVCSKPDGNSVNGLCDLAGNAYEIVEDCWREGYDDLVLNIADTDTTDTDTNPDPAVVALFPNLTAPTDGTAWTDADGECYGWTGGYLSAWTGDNLRTKVGQGHADTIENAMFHLPYFRAASQSLMEEAGGGAFIASNGFGVRCVRDVP